MEFLHSLAEIRTPFFNELFLLVTKLGEEVVLFLVLCIIFWCLDKKLAYRMGFAFLLSSIFIQGLKITCRIDRPWVRDPSFEAVEAAKAHATSYSFPSGHTQSAVSLWWTLGVSVKNAWLRLLLFFIPLAVGFSRMYLGVHTPADVSVAALVAAISVVAVVLLIKPGSDGNVRRIATSVGFALLSVALIIYSLVLYENGTVGYEYASDCCKSAGVGFGFAIGYYIESSFVKFNPRLGKWYMHIVKVVVGVGVLVAIKSGMKLLGDNLVVDTVRYAAIIVWATVLWPMLFKLFIKDNKATE